METITAPDTRELTQRTLAIPEKAQQLLVVDGASYEAATSLLLSVKALLHEVAITFEPITRKLYDAHREALAQRKRHEDPLLKAEAILKPRIAAYLDEQERARALAEKAAQEDAAIAEAEHHEAMGNHQDAEAALNGQGIVNVSVPSAAPKVAGIATRELWSAQVVDKLALIKAVASGQVPPEILDVNTTVANQMARALKTSMQYPGLKAVCTKTVAAGARL